MDKTLSNYYNKIEYGHVHLSEASAIVIIVILNNVKSNTQDTGKERGDTIGSSKGVHYDIPFNLRSSKNKLTNSS